MDDFATINRYCSIEGRHCHETIQFNGPWSFFFAYPSHPKEKSFSKELVEELRGRGFQGVRWEDLVSNDLIFTKVCHAIHANDFLLAEITRPNLNVLLEIGYALAVGRQPVLLTNENYRPWKRNLLTTLESCYYETREDIHKYITRWQQDRPSNSFEPDRLLPFLERMGIYDNAEEKGTVYHLKPKVPTDWISRVDKSFKRSSLKFASTDHSDPAYDEFYTQAREIQHASLIVSSFVCCEQQEWVEKNANVALLTGFSIGLGKQVLVLQEKPIAPILDLGSVSKTFESETRVQEIVDRWIDEQQQLTALQTFEQQRLALSKLRADRLRNIYLGHPDALQDHDLPKYFVRTKEFDDAIQGRRSIFIGRRGSGKSANFQAIMANLSDQPNIVDIEILLDDYQLEEIARFLRSATDLPDARLTFQSIWNYVLTTELLKSLAEKTDRLFYSPEDVSRHSLRYTYDSEYDRLAMEFGSRVVSALESVLMPDEGTSQMRSGFKTEESFKSIINYNLSRQLRDFAKEEKITFFIVADDLDKRWHTNTTQSIDLLLGLFAEVARMKRFFGSLLRIVLFLREDIYDVLARKDVDLPLRDTLRMGWTVPNLRHLVAARLALRSDVQSDEEIWSAIFPEPVNGVNASEYILNRSLPRPREVLSFCQKAIDHAQRNGHSHVTKEDILVGEKTFSEEVFSNISGEFSVLYPNLDEVLIEFAGYSEKTSWSEFELTAKEVIQKNGGSLKKWADGEEISIRFLTEVLFRVGFIGLSRERTSPVHYCNGRSFSEIWSLTASSPFIHIHPAFAHSLEITKSASRASK